MITTVVSLFKGPISNTVPYKTCSIIELHEMITTDTELKEATLCYRAIAPNDKEGRRQAKAKMPKYCTPLGMFRRRVDTGLISLSGLIVIDIDKLESYEAACQLRDLLFADRQLNPDLTFVSVSGLGVKAFVPWGIPVTGSLNDNISMAYGACWDYVEYKYGGQFLMDVDHCGEVSRACTLCFDTEAKIRN